MKLFDLFKKKQPILKEQPITEIKLAKREWIFTAAFDTKIVSGIKIHYYVTDANDKKIFFSHHELDEAKKVFNFLKENNLNTIRTTTIESFKISV
jgi:hypothetical protein